MQKHPAEVYNEKRRIIFSTFHNPAKGISAARDYLESYRQTLGPQGYAGLKAELEFYAMCGQKFSLTVAGDLGEHADFAGQFDGFPTRFDVTTNINVKKFKDYQPFLGGGLKYKIAVFDQINFNIVDIFDLAFPTCQSCGSSHVFPFLLTLGENYNRHGESTWTNDQVLVDICPCCGEIWERERYTHYGLFPISAYAEEIDDEDNQYVNQQISGYSENLYRFAKKLAPVELMGIAETQYKMTDRWGGGDWGLAFPVVNSAISNLMPSFVESTQFVRFADD